jgi:L-amino acid N-acyltransferase YncA
MTDVRPASVDDLDAIRRIYNEGIEDRVATLESAPKTRKELEGWWNEHDNGYAVIVAETSNIVGWASLNRFSHRCAHAAIADLSVYVARDQRGRGIGRLLLDELVDIAVEGGFRKIVLHALDDNEVGKRLYAGTGFREVGVFRQHGTLDGRLVDVIAMERVL